MQDLPSFKVIQAMSAAGTVTGHEHASSSAAATATGATDRSEVTGILNTNSAKGSPKVSGVLSSGRVAAKVGPPTQRMRPAGAPAIMYMYVCVR